MSRIRSVHPGIFTDDKFVSVSDAAQIFYIGLMTEADDNGIFEWNPIKLKMRLRPARDGSVEPLLSELVEAEKVSAYEMDGRKLGAIRNFRRFQRPKFPKASYPINDEWRIYVGLTQSPTVMTVDDDDPIPPNAEKSPQMEEGGGRGEEARKKKDSKYAFESGVIRLTEKDFTNWKASFSYLDLPAELIGASKWAGEQGQNWFHAVSGLLAKRNREAKAAKERTKDSGFRSMSGIDGVI